MSIYHATYLPELGDVIVSDGDVIVVGDRLERPEGADTLDVLRNGEQETMHIDELTDSVNADQAILCKGGFRT